jgi:hypothetical protein
MSPSVICQARLIKIDVEGAELNVVKGISELIPHLSQKTEILMEINKASLAAGGASPKDIIDVFSAVGYEPFVIENEYSPEFYIRTPKVTLYRLEEFNYGQADVVFRRPSPKAY